MHTQGEKERAPLLELVLFTCCVVEGDLELPILLPPSPEGLDYKCVLPCPGSVVLGMEPRSVHTRQQSCIPSFISFPLKVIYLPEKAAQVCGELQVFWVQLMPTAHLPTPLSLEFIRLMVSTSDTVMCHSVMGTCAAGGVADRCSFPCMLPSETDTQTGAGQSLYVGS